MDQVTRMALERVESSASSFWTRSTRSRGARQGMAGRKPRGVQRDILPIVEGTTVNTRYGFVRTDHILFIAPARSTFPSPAI